MSFVKPGDAVTVQFTTMNPSTGASQDADSLPSGTLVRNGVDTAESVTVTNVATGVYSAAVTIPAGYAAGDEVQIRIAATVGGVAGQGIVWGAQVDTKRASDLDDASAADVWGYGSRTLTQAAASVAAAVTGSDITVYRGTDWKISLSGLGDISGYQTIYFTAKVNSHDGDGGAIAQVKNEASDEGLLVINKGGPDAADNGWIDVSDAASGNITIHVKALETAKPSAINDGVYDIKGVKTDGSVDMLSAGGLFVIVEAVTDKIG